MTVAMHNVVVDAVFHEGCAILSAPQALEVGFILSEERLGRALAEQPARADGFLVSLDSHGAGRGGHQRKTRARRIATPRPGVAEPQRGQQVQLRCFGAAVVRGDPDEDVFGSGLGILDEDVEVAVLRKHPRIQQLVFRSLAPAAPILFHQFRIGEGRLRVLIKKPHAGVRRCGVQIEVVLLHILAVVAFVAGQPEQALLENCVAAIPQRQRKADALVAVGDTADAVFAPAIRARASVVMRKVLPRCAVWTVVLAHRAPLPLRKIRPPALPVHLAQTRFFQPSFFHCHFDTSLYPFTALLLWGSAAGEMAPRVRDSAPRDSALRPLNLVRADGLCFTSRARSGADSSPSHPIDVWAPTTGSLPAGEREM